MAALALAMPATAAPLTGHWAGDRLTLVATATGAQLVLDCAAGRIDAPIAPDAAGHFTAHGSFASFQPGPQRADDPAPEAPAMFAGTVTGDRMTISISRPGAERQTYRLARGAAIKPVRCL